MIQRTRSQGIYCSQVCEIFFGTEDDPGARFVQLEDCGHVLEVGGMDQWMELSEPSTEGAVDVQLKCCPKCKTPVRRSRRYGTIVNRTLADIEEVKTRIIGDQAKIKAAKQRVSTALANVHMRSVSVNVQLRSRPVARKINSPVASKINDIKHCMENARLCLEEATCLENITNLLSVLLKLRKAMSDITDDQLVEEMNALEKWALTSRRRLTEQEQTDMSRETTRLTLRVTAGQLSQWMRQGTGDVSKSLSTSFDATVQLLTGGTSLSDEQLKSADLTLQEVRKAVGIGQFTDVEKLQVVKAVGLAKGHWFKCPNGTCVLSLDTGGIGLHTSISIRCTYILNDS